jgi:Na+-driven multidrug efflux pump
VETQAYASGKYWYVLVLGIMTNIPRVALYVVMVPRWGAVGAALAFLLGSVVGFIYSIVLALRMSTKLRWRHILAIILLPLGTGTASYLLHLHWIIGIFLVLAVSGFGYVFLKITPREEVSEIANSLYLKPFLGKVWPFNKIL